MNTLWVFGDSYSAPFSKIQHEGPWKSNYIQWKGYTPKCYSEFVADKLQLKHINLAVGGTDNYTILDSIISKVDSIDTNDIIIIGWSNTIRFRVVNIHNDFTTILVYNATKTSRPNNGFNSSTELSDSTLTELIINRDSSKYIDELNNYIKLINFSFKKNKVIHWSPFVNVRDRILPTKKCLINLETVTQETNGIVDDGHFSENAHYELAEYFLDIINSYEYPSDKKYI